MSHEDFERLWLRQQYPEALLAATEALAAARRAHDHEHPVLVRALLDLAMAQKATGDFEASERTQQDATEMLVALKARAERIPDHPETADFLIFEADQKWLELGDHPEVRQRLEQAQAIREAAFGKNDIRVGEVLARRAELAFIAGALGDAEPLYHDAIAIFDDAGVYQNPYLRKSLQGLGQTLAGLERDEEAEIVFARAIDLTRPFLTEKQSLYFLRIYRAECLERLGRAGEAGYLRTEAEALLPRNNPGAQGYNPSGV